MGGNPDRTPAWEGGGEVWWWGSRWTAGTGGSVARAEVQIHWPDAYAWASPSGQEPGQVSPLWPPEESWGRGQGHRKPGGSVGLPGSSPQTP